MPSRMKRSAPANTVTTSAATQPNQAGAGIAGTSRPRSDGEDDGEDGELLGRAVMVMRFMASTSLGRVGSAPGRRRLLSVGLARVR
ncbi:hypothetical protein Nans01_12830 [Nocardiopsis ansamitocini]|uniref:Uncharacterized protein n=1 Tax=Nocardiopsis ansamitocini TaxID=1670832 RepID=A0A9W6P4G8_9ACTN|nr:hypothetical protein Nans01_12830 [Nocardiopsis ansamitocini]